MFLLGAAPIAAQTAPDLTGVDQFWAVADRLAADSEPAPSQWRRLFDTPAYRQLDREVRLQRFLRLAYQPSAQQARDSILRLGGYEAHVLEHLQRVLTERAALLRFRDALAASDLVGSASDLAQAYLPPGQITRRPPPTISFGFYGPEAYGATEGITVDLLFALDRGDFLLPILGHEVHHVHVADLTGLRLPEQSSPAFVLLQALRNLVNEGTADRINLHFPVEPPAMTPTAAPVYNAAYDSARATLAGLDTLFARIDGDSATMRATGTLVSARLVHAGHPVGAYLAERIEGIAGRQALIDALGNPFAFLRAYNDAEWRGSGRRIFSPASLAFLARLEGAYYTSRRP